MSSGSEHGREVLDSGFRILRALPDADERRQMSSLAELTSMPRSTVYRLLRQLRHSGAAELRADGRWAVSPQLLGVAGPAHPLDGIRTSANRVIQALREQTGAAVSLVVATGASLIALEMVPGREDLPIEAYSGVEMPGQSAAGLVLGPGTRRSPRARPFAAAVDDQDLVDGLTCYARLLTLPGGQKASLQIATSSHRRAENFAAHVQRAGNAIEALAAGRGH
jgi:DNA-binding transcriptional ArsR family regulator